MPPEILAQVDELSPELLALLSPETKEVLLPPSQPLTPAPESHASPPSRQRRVERVQKLNQAATPPAVLAGDADKLPRGSVRRQQIHDVMRGNWEIVERIVSSDGKRSIRTAPGFWAKVAYKLRDRDTGREILAAKGEIEAHTNLTLPVKTRRQRVREFSASFD